MTVRRVSVWALNHSGDRRAFRERQARKVLAEEDARCLLYTADADGAALPQVNLVAVKREDIFLRQPAFERERGHRFGKLSTERPLRRQKSVLDQLLSNGRAALRSFNIGCISPKGAANSPYIYAAVLEEAPVFYREDSLREHRRNIAIG